MTTFKQFLAEEGSVTIEQIKKDGADFLRRSQSRGFLWRGMNFARSEQYSVMLEDKKYSVYKVRVRKDRIPMSTNAKLSKILDNWFEEELGFKARSGGLFCYGEDGRHTAGGYNSRLGIIIPIGKIAYAWSPKVVDLYNDIIEELSPSDSHKYSGELKPEYMTDGVYNVEAIEDWLRSKGFTINGLEKAVTSNKEIMLDCDEFWAFNSTDLQSDGRRELREALGIDE